MILKGRKKIISDVRKESLNDPMVIMNLVNETMGVHQNNRLEIDFLFNYKNGDQDILNKVKPVRDDVNNMVVINHAQMITRNIVGYFLGTPIQYIQNGGSDNKEELDKLNRFVAYEDKASVDKELAEIQSICGTAYRIIYTDGGLYSDDVPFEDASLDPRNTYVVYENSIGSRPLVGVTYYSIFDGAREIGRRYYVYTDFGMYEFITDGDVIETDDEVKFTEYRVGGVPIIEYPNNLWRIGDWELCIGLMDAINKLHSGRLDDIDQIVQSLLIFINAELNEETYNEMIDKGIIQLVNNTTNQSQIESISNPLDQAGMNMFAKELSDMLYAIIGIPTRENRSGGGDTGQAVELRDGWAELEVVARNKELEFKKAEKKALKIILTIMNNKTGSKLNMIDIDIKFTRNKNNNLLVKTQGYMNLLGTKTLSPADCLTIVDLVSDVNEYIARGQAFWGEDFANKVTINPNKGKLETNNNSKKEPSDNGSEE